MLGGGIVLKSKIGPKNDSLKHKKQGIHPTKGVGETNILSDGSIDVVASIGGIVCESVGSFSPEFRVNSSSNGTNKNS